MVTSEEVRQVSWSTYRHIFMIIYNVYGMVYGTKVSTRGPDIIE
jgi:hypothetical protein